MYSNRFTDSIDINIKTKASPRKEAMLYNYKGFNQLLL
ncbi:hypothetical protein MuYL_1097 [Mucilaginibacter xinganensis]|uniref:Uncharacterized protein n=1 Tax=Mucilaginibacter xinganensis TaxID=1234841 RepID=A0A223NT18_9SPHI|nr:hypothetical protein MuYL_1097 [Mucilaginibacter xinganensis]